MSDPAITPRPAASLILMRDGAAGLEVLVGLRPEHIRAFPGATAFPGGKIEPQDRAWPGAPDDPARTAAHAALRETFEETGLLICDDGEGPPPNADVAAARAAVESGELALPELLERWARRLDPGRLIPFARFVTPESYPHRFDTWLFIAAASAYEAGAELICAEFEALRWAAPGALLDDGATRLPRPTQGNLMRLRTSCNVAEALATARREGVYEPRMLEGLIAGRPAGPSA